VRRPALALAAALLATACAIPPPPPAAPPVAEVAIEDGGQIALPDPAQAAFCVAQAMPVALVDTLQDGAAVRPVVAAPDYALLLGFAGPATVDWRLRVGAAPFGTEATALRLRQALADCLARLGRAG